MAEEASQDILRLEASLAELQRAKPHPDDNRTALFEITSGVGGDESSLFASDLFKMYEAYCNNAPFTLEVSDFSPGNVGGFKSICFSISGKNAYKTFKHESGVHRVQRVPKTETKGRVHTSVANIVVLPEIEVEDIELNKNDVDVEPFNSGGKGGQHSNKTLNAARLIHRPTGITATSQMKSFPQNLKIAWAILATRLNDHFSQQQQAEEDALRQEVRGTGNRSDKIRTYNYPQDRVTDHRTKTKYPLQSTISGDIKQLLEDISNADLQN